MGEETVINIDLKDLAQRALNTFIQTFLVTWLLSDQPLTKTAVVGALAASLSVVMTTTRGIIQNGQNTR